METQLDFIRKKSNFLFAKLYPYLTNATADGRKDMWRTMICPLFNGLLALFYFEDSDTHMGNFFGLWYSTFKKFMLIPQSTNGFIVDEMLGIDPVELIMRTSENAVKKWYSRWNREELKEKPELVKKKESKNYLKGIPNEWCTILKQQCGLCKICKNSTRNPSHMEFKHGIKIQPYKEIWDLIKKFYDSETEKQKKKNKIMKVKREVFLKEWKDPLQKIIEDTTEKFNPIFQGNSKDVEYTK
jgi:hypothetical protein